MSKKIRSKNFRKVDKEKFFTKSDIVDICLKTLDLNEYDFIIEPSAGNGSFYNKIKHKNKIGIDIDPSSSNILKKDYLKYSIDKFPPYKKILVIGNPPFGKQSSLAFKFIKKSCSLNADIAFILPKGFKKQSSYDKIPLNYKKVFEMDLPKNSFIYYDTNLKLIGKDYDVPCVWQIYKKSKTLRKKEEKLQPKYFDFVKVTTEKPENRKLANLAIRRVGVNAGKIFKDTNVSITSHYFISTKEKKVLLDNVNPSLFSYDDTTGPRSISKNELINVLDQIIKSNNI